jgi:GABA(A) receptor-associated protein
MQNPIYFKTKHTFEYRFAEAQRIKKKFPMRIPIIVEKSNTNKTLPFIDKNKFLTPSDLTLGQFYYVIRKRIKLDSNAALFFFINDAMFPVASMIDHIYNENKDEDGFLYITYTSENTFG